MSKRELIGNVEDLQRRVRDLERQAAEHRQAQDALRQQALILEQMSDGVIVTDLEGRIIDWNPAAERMFGYRKDEVLGRTPAFMHRPAEAARLTAEIVEGVARDGRWSGEITVTCKDLTERVCEVIVVAFHNEHGQRVATIGVNRDIGDRKQVEKALREANESLKKEVAERERAEEVAAQSHTLLTEAVEALSDGFIISDADERLVLCNSKYREIYREVAHILVPGTPLKEIGRAVAKHCLGIESPDEIEAVVQRRLARLRSHKGPLEQKLKDDRWILVSESPLANGWTVGVRTDITELKRREAALQASETQFRAMADDSPVIFWINDIDDRPIFLNRTAREFLGLSHKEALARDFYDLVHPEDRERVRIQDRQCVERRVPRRYEYRMRRSDGAYRWLLEVGVPRLAPDGTFLGTIGSTVDITEQKEALDAQRQSEARLIEAIETMNDGFVFFDSNERLVVCNSKYREMYRKVAHLMEPGRSFEEIIHAYSRCGEAIAATGRREDWARERLARFRNPAASYEAQIGKDRWIRVTDRKTEDGGTVGLRTDITEFKQRQEALRRSEARLIEAIEAMNDGFVFYDADERLAICNSKYRELYPEVAHLLAPGESFETIIRASAECGETAAALEQADLWFENRLARFRDPTGSYEEHMKDGSWIRVTDRRTEDGGTVGLRTDITELKHRQEALRQSDARFREIFEESPVSLWEEDWSPLKQMLDNLKRQGVEDYAGYFRDNPEQFRQAYDASHVVDISRETLRVYRAGSKAELLAVLGSVHADPDEMAGFAKTVEAFAAGMTSHEYEAEEIACDGTQIVTRIRTVLPPQNRDSWSRVLITIDDITEQKRDQQALAQSEIRYRDLFDESPVAMLEEDWRPVKEILEDLVAQGVSDIAGYLLSHPDKLGQVYEAPLRFGISRAAVELYHAANADELRAAMTRDTADPDELTGYANMVAAFLDGAMSYEYEADEIACDGSAIVTRIRAVIPPKYSDVWSRIFFTIEDITERRNVEAQLRQAQKMKAIGQLTGGVAHDFNNLLAVILGNAEILQLRHGEGDQPTQAVIRAAIRGAELTQRLLAFSRKQPLRPQIVDLNSLVSDMSDMLHRTLGAMMEIRISPAPDLWRALADPGQLENALLNLAINARDAMPGGGKLTIETSNISFEPGGAVAQTDFTPGDYVVLAVSDSGTGMPPEVLEQVFDPFFTTKEIGEGSGLGLSMVYGFVKQTGGHITIYSEPGHGTTVKLYLPRATASSRIAGQLRSEEQPGAQGETVLLVEDDEDVRAFAASTLEDLGYLVIQAHDGPTALATLDDDVQVDLLLSDMVLPGGTDGTDLAKAVMERRPAIKVLMMSGYAQNAMLGSGPLAGDIELLSKPFRRRDLAQRTRAALDRNRGGPSTAVP